MPGPFGDGRKIVQARSRKGMDSEKACDSVEDLIRKVHGETFGDAGDPFGS